VNEEKENIFHGTYDAGVVIFRDGVPIYLDNGSGHIRSTRDNFLKNGLCSELIQENAYLGLETLMIYYKEKKKVLKEDEFTIENKILSLNGNADIVAFFRDNGLFYDETKNSMPSVTQINKPKNNTPSSTRKIIGENGFARHRNSLIMYKDKHKSQEIYLMINNRLSKIASKTYSPEKQPIKIAEAKFLTHLLEKSPHDLQSAVQHAHSKTSPELFKKFTAKKLMRPTSPTRKIIKKIAKLTNSDSILLKRK
jgi:hypothetical protein